MGAQLLGGEFLTRKDSTSNLYEGCFVSKHAGSVEAIFFDLSAANEVSIGPANSNGCVRGPLPIAVLENSKDQLVALLVR